LKSLPVIHGTILLKKVKSSILKKLQICYNYFCYCKINFFGGLVHMATEKVKVPFFKRWYVMLVLGIIIGGIAFSGGDSTETVITDEAPVEEAATSETETTEEEAPKEEAPKVEEKAPVKVWENDQVVISFKDVTAEGVRFLMENKSDKELTVQADSVAVNGFSSNDIMMSDAVAPKSKGYIIAQTTELADVGTPETVSAGMTVIDFDSANADSFNVTFTNVSVK
jgi:hypothetical protein